MPRLEPVSEPDDAQSEFLAKTLMSPTGEPLNVFATLAHYPRLGRRINALGGYFMVHGELSDRVRELVILRTAGLIGCDYEIAQHRWIGDRAGLTPEEIEAAIDGSVDHEFSAEEKILLGFTDELVASDTVSESTWRSLGGSFGEQQKVELLALVGFYRMLGGILNGLEVEIDESVTDGL